MLFPPRQVCPICGKSQEDRKICGACLHKVSNYRNDPVCYQCGRFFSKESAIRGIKPEELICRDCFNESRYFSVARSAGPYEDDLKKAVQRLKFFGKRELAVHFSDVIFQGISGNRLFRGVEMIIPVPLSPKRLKTRGFNQSELLAFGLAKHMSVSVIQAVIKVRETKPQTALSRSERASNLSGAFSLTDSNIIRAKTVLLVDDIITTGNTLNTVSEVLIKGGAGEVLCATVASGRISTPPVAL